MKRPISSRRGYGQAGRLATSFGRLTDLQARARGRRGMGQQSALSIDTVSSTLDAVTRASRLLVLLVAAAGITGVGTCVFFELVSLFPCYASSSFRTVVRPNAGRRRVSFCVDTSPRSTSVHRCPRHCASVRDTHDVPFGFHPSFGRERIARGRFYFHFRATF
ncbi:hypothetical protein D8S78_03430 [Natrialba swarupiae]|nr:hypothetical protein [Natrialba swarupiae]